MIQYRYRYRCGTVDRIGSINECSESCIDMLQETHVAPIDRGRKAKGCAVADTVPALVSYSYVHMSTVLSHTRLDLARNGHEK